MKRTSKIILSCLLVVVLAVTCMVALPQKVEANWQTTYYWPVMGHTSLSRGYQSGHNAIDIADGAINGATVCATIGGTVYARYTCTQQHSGSMHTCDGMGTGLIIKGDDGWFYTYAHMQGGSIPSGYTVGAYVSAAATIGRVGTTGNSTGAHLHYSISSNSSPWNTDIDPMALSYRYSTVQYENLGNDFYGRIKHSSGNYVCNVNNNVELGKGGTDASKWHFIRQNDGSYSIYSCVNGGLLDVADAGTADGTNIAVCTRYTGSLAQNWNFMKIGQKYSLITSLCGKAMDLYANKTAVGTNIQIYTQNGSDYQLFTIENACDHTYSAATCTKAKTCTQCGETSGSALGHSYSSATCTKAATCTRCNATSGSALGHTYSNGCDKTCNRCGATRTTKHTFVDNACNNCKAKSAKITTQPKTGYAKKGTYASVTVKATGDGLTYTWFVKDVGDKTYTQSSQKTNTYKVKITNTTKNRKAYCVIKDKYGNTVKTETVTLKLKTIAKITSNPASKTVKKNTTAKFTVKAVGDGLVYRWQVKTPTGSWKGTTISGYNTKTIKVPATKARNNFRYRCVITDKYGNKVISNAAKLVVK